MKNPLLYVRSYKVGKRTIHRFKVTSTNKFSPHQGKHERARRRWQATNFVAGRSFASLRRSVRRGKIKGRHWHQG